MRKVVLFSLAMISCWLSFGQTFDVSDLFKVIDLKTNNLEKQVMLCKILPTIEQDIKVENRKIYQREVEITVDSILDTITVTQGISDAQIITAYFNPNHWHMNIISSFSRENERNIGLLRLETKEDWSTSIQSYIYLPINKHLIYNEHPDVYFSTVRLDSWLIISDAITLIIFLSILATVVIFIIKKKSNKEGAFIDYLFDMHEGWTILLIILLIISFIIIASHHFWSLIIWLALYIIAFVLPFWTIEIKRYFSKKKKKRKTK